MKKRRDGFTLVEVMVSLGVMTIGAMALMAMQQQTTRANIHAREMTTAMQIAQNWIERLKLDSMQWTTTPGALADDLATTNYLKSILLTPGDGVFQAAAAAPTNVLQFARFNFMGEDLASAAASDAAAVGADQMSNAVRYCASYRLSWVYPRRAMRADVRVWWPRDLLGGGKTTANDIAQDFPGCVDDNDALNPGGAEYDNYHVVYLSTTLRPVNL